ncbi:MAG: hypothetical protein WDA21_03440 [Bacilli bacterium]
MDEDFDFGRESQGITNDTLGLIVALAKQTMKVEAIVGGNYNDSSKIWGMMEKLCTRSFVVRFTCCDTYFYVCEQFSSVFSGDGMDCFDSKELEKIIDMIPELENNILCDNSSEKNIKFFCKVLEQIHSISHNSEDMTDAITFINLIINLGATEEDCYEALDQARKTDCRRFLLTVALELLEGESNKSNEGLLTWSKAMVAHGGERYGEGEAEYKKRMKRYMHADETL